MPDRALRRTPAAPQPRGGHFLRPNASNARQGIKTLTACREANLTACVRTPPMPDRALRRKYPTLRQVLARVRPNASNARQGIKTPRDE